MLPMLSTRGRRAVPAIALATFVAGACASSGGGPIYELRPTAAPLTYVLSSEGSNDVETPAGPQGSNYSGEAVLTLEIGELADAGRSFTAIIQSATFEAGGDFGNTTVDLTEELAGKPFRGLIGPEGDVTFTESPEFTKGRMSTPDMERLVAGVMFPLPPGGDPSAGPWTHRLTLPAGGGLDGRSAYEGVMTLVGDTVWNGITASVMASTGTVTIEATGMPEGSPAEIELAMDVEARTTYIWDAARGVLLEVRAVGEGAGDVSTMGFSMPLSAESESVITLQQ